MFVALIACSDHECENEIQAIVADLDDLDGYVCECGYGFILLAVEAERAA